MTHDIEKVIDRAKSLIQLKNSPEFINYLRPLLEELSIIKPVEPSVYKLREMYQYELMIRNAEANAIKKLLQIIDNQDAVLTNASKQLYTLKLQDEARTSKVTR